MKASMKFLFKRRFLIFNIFDVVGVFLIVLIAGPLIIFWGVVPLLILSCGVVGISEIGTKWSK